MTRISARQLGRSGTKVSAMGLGCWPIGGQMFFDGKSDSYGEVDDNESIRAIRRALAWLWGRSEKTIPIPDFKTTRQIEENIAAMEFGPLSADQMRGIEEILGPRSFTY